MPSLDAVVRRFGIVPADLIDFALHTTEAQPLAEDDPENAIGRRIARVDVEELLAAVHLTFEDGYYLTFAARVDEAGVILLDDFCAPLAAGESFAVFEELVGDFGPPPPGAGPRPGTPYDPATWIGAAGRTLAHIGWYEEGMQVFLHFEEGGYLTLAARAVADRAFVAGYFAPRNPESDDAYILFAVPDDQR